MDHSAAEYSESTTTTLEWTVRGLKQLFDSSKGELKSKVTKSIKFGGGRWQVLFYANSGHEGGNFVSLYLSCEPTEEEKERAINGKWVREGLFKFSFEVRNVNRGPLSSTKEACDHAFSYKTANWGWAQFAKRDAVFYNPNTVRHVDAFLIICNITSSPSPPSPVPAVPIKAVPRELMDAVGGLFDDPVYSDVAFILPARRIKKGRRAKPARIIYAAKRILQRVDYFNTMFSAGFAEAASDTTSVGKSSTGRRRSDSISLSIADGGEYEDTIDSDDDREAFDDSDESADDEDDANTPSTPIASQHNQQQPGLYFNPRNSTTSFDPPSSSTAVNSIINTTLPDDVDRDSGASTATVTRAQTPLDDEAPHGAEEAQDEENGHNADGESGGDSEEDASAGQNQTTDDGASTVRNVDASPKDRERGAHRARGPRGEGVSGDEASIPGPKKTKSSITFGPPSPPPFSTSASQPPLSQQQQQRTASSSSLQGQQPPYNNHTHGGGHGHGHTANHPLLGENGEALHRSRKEWIKAWMGANPGKPAPCSAKACYRLADKLGLTELRKRAFDHILKSLTVANVPYEAFSSFSAAFEDVRKSVNVDILKVQVDFFLANWSEIRSSDAMRNVFQQIRLGRHPGFEEVWPLIISHLEFIPRAPSETGGDGTKQVTES
ncbi:hypothetical protein BS47DRAFT_1368336 [Hydnum rufescens UP504]|uniref:MATH domain-containing protein n=1 Tax=Hydnum rufescens UP504 TaxID=1448309 RepID=A0A9P6AGC3_9AGAM|nr:hypothetical protein BS47DRAFT_1368336 [Hydnum rufescens UP504]